MKLLNFSGLVLVFLCANSFAANSSNDDCQDVSHLEMMQCDSKKMDAAKAELEALYQSALRNRPIDSPTDSRKARSQLEKAQAAWQKYVDEHCSYVGGLTGGNNAWVSDFASKCEMEEIQKRIDFFRKLPQGG